MLISPIDQQVTDFDWYAVDLNGYLVQFASSGGPLPTSVASSHEALEQLHTYFLSLPLQSSVIHFNPNLIQIVRGLTDMKWYLDSFTGFAQRGLFAFDKTDTTHQDNAYHLVAALAKGLQLAQLPSAIAALVSRTRLPFAIRNTSTVDANCVQ